jgi:hypothetical protein
MHISHDSRNGISSNHESRRTNNCYCNHESRKYPCPPPPPPPQWTCGIAFGDIFEKTVTITHPTFHSVLFHTDKPHFMLTCFFVQNYILNTYHSSNTIHHYHHSNDSIHHKHNTDAHIGVHCYIWIHNTDNHSVMRMQLYWEKVHSCLNL